MKKKVNSIVDRDYSKFQKLRNKFKLNKWNKFKIIKCVTFWVTACWLTSRLYNSMLYFSSDTIKSKHDIQFAFEFFGAENYFQIKL